MCNCRNESSPPDRCARSHDVLSQSGRDRHRPMARPHVQELRAGTLGATEDYSAHLWVVGPHHPMAGIEVIYLFRFVQGRFPPRWTGIWWPKHSVSDSASSHDPSGTARAPTPLAYIRNRIERWRASSCLGGTCMAERSGMVSPQNARQGFLSAKARAWHCIVGPGLGAILQMARRIGPEHPTSHAVPASFTVTSAHHLFSRGMCWLSTGLQIQIR